MLRVPLAVFRFFKFIRTAGLADQAAGSEDHHDHQDGPEYQHAVFGKGPQVFREQDQEQGAENNAQGWIPFRRGPPRRE